MIISAPARELPLHRHLVGNARQSWVHTLGHRCDGRGLGQEGPNR